METATSLKQICVLPEYTNWLDALNVPRYTHLM